MQKLSKLAKLCGERIYIVGGAVRNMLMGIEGDSDCDICGTAMVEQIIPYAEECGFTVKAVYKRTGTVLLHSDGGDLEYTCFRTDSYKDDSHTPTGVTFTKDINVDALRRDFKCNAVYLNVVTGEIVDPLGGVEDIKNKVLSTPRAPEQTFGEDGLRLMRLFRFCAELDFYPTEQTIKGAKANAFMIKGISAERIYSELIKILNADKKYNVSNIYGHYNGLSLMDKTGVLDYIFPELAMGRGMEQPALYHAHDVLEHTLRTVKYAPSEVRLAALLHDIGKPYCYNKNGNYHNHEVEGVPIAEKVLKRLKAPNSVIDETLRLVRLHMEDSACNQRIAKVRVKICQNYDIIDKLFALKNADAHACRDNLTVINKSVERWSGILEQMKAEKVPFKLADLKIKGDDLVKIGFRGEEIGKTLNLFFKECILKPTLNDKEQLIMRANRKYKRAQRKK